MGGEEAGEEGGFTSAGGAGEDEGAGKRERLGLGLG